MMLLVLRRQTPLIIQAANLRLAGRAADADFLLARSWLERSNPVAASELLKSVIDARRAANDTIGAQQAQLYLDYATLLNQTLVKSRRMTALDDLRKAAARSTNAATATTAN